MTVSFIHPHDPYVARPEFWDRYEGVEIDLPTSPLAEDPHSLRLRSAIEATDVLVTDEQIANARRAYYANTTYVDSKVGEIVRTLEEAELLDDTIVVFTGDHGDMLGERGPGTRCRPWITRCGYRCDGRAGHRAWGVAGALLVGRHAADNARLGRIGRGRRWAWTWTAAPALQQQVRRQTPSTALGVYCAEGSAHPIFMIRRGRWKYVQCDIDPPMLFDMDADPEELQNLAADPSYVEVEAAFAAEVRERWDSAQIRADVLASQRMRRPCTPACRSAVGSTGTISRGAMPEEYVRNHMDWTVAAATTRFPPIAGATGRS